MKLLKLLTTHQKIFFTLLGFILILILFTLNLTPPPKIISTDPTNQSLNISLESHLNIKFEHLSTSQFKKLKFKLQPQTPFTTTYTQNNITIIPNPKLTKNSHYSLYIYFKRQLIYQLNFTTNPYDQADLEQQLKLQSKDDLNFAKAWDNLNQKYPWYSSLPIIKDDYYIAFDTINQIFNIHLTNKPKTKQQKQQLTNQAIKDLQQIGVDSANLNYQLFID